MTIIEGILERVDRHLKDTGMNATAFGHAVLKNGALLQRLRSGNATAKTLQAVVDYLDEHDAPKKKRA